MCNWKALFVTNMKLNYLVASKILLQGVLFAFFFKYFGLVSWRRYKEQRIVLTSSDEKVDMLPAPAITFCPVNHQDQTGYKNLTTKNTISVILAKYLEIKRSGIPTIPAFFRALLP